MSSSEAITSTEFIRHHLTNLTFGRHADGHWGMAHSGAEAAEMGFMAVHVDSLFWSFTLGVLFLWVFRSVAKTVTSGEPGMLQNFVEWIVDFIDGNVRDSFTGKNDLIAPMALTLFCWVFLMNFMDLIPVEVIPRFLELFGIHFQKVVPTTDPNITINEINDPFDEILQHARLAGSHRFRHAAKYPQKQYAKGERPEQAVHMNSHETHFSSFCTRMRHAPMTIGVAPKGQVGQVMTDKFS